MRRRSVHAGAGGRAGREWQADDFAKTMPDGPFDGVLAANSLHFVRDRKPVLAEIRRVLRPAGRLVIVEYDADAGNPWVPYPFSFDRWRYEATAAGFEKVELLHRVPSRFLGGIYGAVATSARLSERPSESASGPEVRATLPPHGRDREE
ncbi:MAG: methyltransferase domain-containing protein [Chloroflexota bacterium]